MLSIHEIHMLAEEIAKHLPVQDELLNKNQVAEMLNISPLTVVRKASKGELPYHQRGRKFYFSKKEITETYLKDEL